MHAVWVWTRKAQGTITVLDAAGISYEKRHFWGNGNTRAYSDLSAVDILSLIYKVAAAMWPLVTAFIATCYAPAVGGALSDTAIRPSVYPSVCPMAQLP